MLLGNGGYDLVLAKTFASGTTERRIRFREDVVLLQPGDQFDLRTLERQLDLVLNDRVFSASHGNAIGTVGRTHDRLDASDLEDLFSAVDVEVGDTNGFAQALIHELEVRERYHKLSCCFKIQYLPSP